MFSATRPLIFVRGETFQERSVTKVVALLILQVVRGWDHTPHYCCYNINIAPFCSSVHQARWKYRTAQKLDRRHEALLLCSVLGFNNQQEREKGRRLLDSREYAQKSFDDCWTWLAEA